MQIDEDQRQHAPRRVVVEFDPGEVVAEARPRAGSTVLHMTLEIPMEVSRTMLHDGDLRCAFGAAVAFEAQRAHTLPPMALDGDVLFVPGAEVEVPAGTTAVWSRVAAVTLEPGTVFRLQVDGHTLGPWRAEGVPFVAEDGRLAVKVSAP